MAIFIRALFSLINYPRRRFLRLSFNVMRVPVRLLYMLLVLGMAVPAILMLYSLRSQGSPQDVALDARADDGPTRVSGTELLDHEPAAPVGNQLWRQHLESECKRLSMVPANKEVTARMVKFMLVDDVHKLMYCPIPKVASTTWRRVFLLLSGKLGQVELMKLKANDVHHKFDKYLTYLGDFSPEERQYRLDNYFKFVVVREPFERLLSAFRNKFVTNTNSSVYFKRVFGTQIIKHYKQNPPKQALETGNGVTFEEFLKYLTDPAKPIKTNEHWDRFTNLCQPCLIQYDFIGKLETMEADSRYILKKSGVEDLVKFPSRSESRYSKHYTNSYMTEYYSKIPRPMLRQLYEEYRADFAVFNYSVPKEIRALLH